MIVFLVFLDGPAAGVSLEVRRAPVLLRAVRDPAGNWDALDQLDDAPREGETVYVYRRTGKPTMVHLYFGGGRGRWEATATYQELETQPTAGDVLTTVGWRTYCEAVRCAEVSR